MAGVEINVRSMCVWYYIRIYICTYESIVIPTISDVVINRWSSSSSMMIIILRIILISSAHVVLPSLTMTIIAIILAEPRLTVLQSAFMLPSHVWRGIICIVILICWLHVMLILVHLKSIMAKATMNALIIVDPVSSSYPCSFVSAPMSYLVSLCSGSDNRRVNKKIINS